MVKNYLSAKAARQVVETSEKMISIAFKRIKEEAEYGKNETWIDIYTLDSTVIERIKQTLIGAGYSVTEKTEDIEGVITLVALVVKW
jgi:hypothetical protein